MIRGFLLLLLAIPAIAPAQNRFQSLIKNVNDYVFDNPWSKVYLHTDKPHYSPGDTLWFKAYVVLGPSHFADTISVPLYVDLFHSGTSTLVERKAVRLENGVGNGEFVVPLDSASEFLTIRAYTEWMRNAGEAAFFTKVIPVDGKERTGLPVFDSLQFDLKFMPESGQMVVGLESKIAFKAIGANGLSTEVSGFILSGASDTVATFFTTHLGMGSFIFKPTTHVGYRAYAKVAKGKFTEIKFPEIQVQGFQIQVDNISSSSDIKIFVQQSLPKKMLGKEVLLLATMGGQAVFQANFALSDQGKRLVIPKSTLPSGILTLTLLDGDANPICERIAYINPSQLRQAVLKTEKEEYTKREEVQLHILAKDSKGNPLVGEFSVAATDALQVYHRPYSENILTYLNLSSELSGHIENPGYYFDPSNTRAKIDLDLLMLTQGWRRYDWGQIKTYNENSTPSHFFEMGLKMSGKVLTLGGKPIDAPRQLSVMINPLSGGFPIMMEGETDSEGNFTFHNLDFEDSVGVFVQAFTEKEKRSGETKLVKTNKVERVPNLFPTFDSPLTVVHRHLDPFVHVDKDNDYIVEVGKAENIREQFHRGQDILLSEVTIKAKAMAVRRDTRDRYYGGNPSHRLEVSPEMYRFQNIYQLLKGRFPGVEVKGDSFNEPVILMRGGIMNAGNTSGGAGAKFYVNGIPVSKGTAECIPIHEIEKIDVIKELSKLMVFGQDGAGGIVNILTRSGNPTLTVPNDPRMALGNLAFNTMGFSTPTKYYVPRYDPKLPQVLQQDYRSTIYWNPTVKTDAEGKATVSFPVTDGQTNVKIILEGMGINGEAVYAETMVRVR